MKVSDFSYNLPEELIAKHPPKTRGSSRLLVLDKQTGQISHTNYSNFVDYIQPGDVVVLNDTKVIKARLVAKNSKNQVRELLLLEDHNNTDFNRRKVLCRGNLIVGEILSVRRTAVTVMSLLGDGIAEIISSVNLIDLAEQVGSVPLPPYLKRAATKEDTERYQTVFARDPGSVAAPTASLNFTHELEKKLIAKGAVLSYLTLHVGIGTFLPIRSDNVEGHKMHSEYFEIPPSTIRKIRTAKRTKNKVIAIGTTVARTLEYANSHFSFLLEASPLPKGRNVIKDNIPNISGEADIFIYPGYEFKTIDALLTNFHAPKSTVLMLAAAFAGWENLEKAYKIAVENKYTLLSYGDSMLIC